MPNYIKNKYYEEAVRLQPSYNKELTQDQILKAQTNLSCDFYGFSILDVYKGWQVVRTFEVKRHFCKPDKNETYPLIRDKNPVPWYNNLTYETYKAKNRIVMYEFHEIIQWWEHPEYKDILCFSKHRVMCSTCFSKSSELKIRKYFEDENLKMYGGSDYTSFGTTVYRRKVLEKYKGMKTKDILRNISKRMKDIADEKDELRQERAAKMEESRKRKLMESPLYEFLQKGNQTNLIDYYLMKYNTKKLEDYAIPIKIANRHKYVVTDVSLWTDTIDLMKKLDADIHNPVFVCPKDLRDVHNKFYRKYVRKKEILDAKAEHERIMQYEESYQDFVKKFLDIDLNVGNTNVHIFACPTVMDMYEEGKHMHHCVYRMRYYMKKSSLILLARTDKNERVATIEININQGSVVQIRGVKNDDPLFYNEILKTLKDNMTDITNPGKVAMKQAV